MCEPVLVEYKNYCSLNLQYIFFRKEVIAPASVSINTCSLLFEWKYLSPSGPIPIQQRKPLAVYKI
jgi:hypothetical protein